jgi:hypothetical protein
MGILGPPDLFRAGANLLRTAAYTLTLPVEQEQSGLTENRQHAWFIHVFYFYSAISGG